MSETPKIKYSEDWQESPPSMSPGEIAVNADITPPTLFTANVDGVVGHLPGIIYTAATPQKPIEGTLWINTTTSILSFWDGQYWVAIGTSGGSFGSGDFVGWMDATILGGGLTPPIDSTNAGEYDLGAYARVAVAGWYNLQTGAPVDGAIGGPPPANAVYLSDGETVLRDDASSTGWRAMEDGAPPLGKLALHNLSDISLPEMEWTYTTGDYDGATSPAVIASPQITSDGSASNVVHQFTSGIRAAADIDQGLRYFRMMPAGFMLQSDMNTWGDPADPARPEIPGNPGHLDLFDDWAYLPKATILAEISGGGANAIIRNPSGVYNTITPLDVDTAGLIIETLADQTEYALQIKRPNGLDGVTIDHNGTVAIQGVLGVSDDAVFFSDAKFSDKVNPEIFWRINATQRTTSTGVKTGLHIEPDPNTPVDDRMASIIYLGTSDLTTDYFFVFKENGRLFLPADPINENDAVNLRTLQGFGIDKFMSLTGEIDETADGQKTFSDVVYAEGGLLSRGIITMASTNLVDSWTALVGPFGGLNTVLWADGGDTESQYQIRTKDAALVENFFVFESGGYLRLPKDPTGAMEAVTKQYVDGLVGGGPFMSLTGGVAETADGDKTFTELITAEQGMTAGAAVFWLNDSDPTKGWTVYSTDAALNYMVLGAWSDTSSSRLRIITRSGAGGTSRNFTFRETGHLEIPQDPTAATHAVRKNFIDTTIIDDSQTYRMIRDKAAGSGSWIRSPIAGFLPNANGGNSSSLGTSSWRWKNIYGEAGNFDTLFVGGEPIAPVDTTDLMTLSTPQEASGEKTFTAPVRAKGGVASDSFLQILNVNDLSKDWLFRAYNSGEHYLQITGGDRLSGLLIDTRASVGGTNRRFFFRSWGQLELPLDPVGASDAVRLGWVQANVYDDSQTYRGIRGKNGTTSGWVRPPTNGILPYASGGNSSDLGTSVWRWRNIYGSTGNINTLTVNSALTASGTSQFNGTVNYYSAGGVYSGFIRGNTNNNGTLQVQGSVGSPFIFTNNRLTLPATLSNFYLTTTTALPASQRNAALASSEMTAALSAAGVLPADVADTNGDPGVYDLEKVVLELLKKVALLSP